MFCYSLDSVFVKAGVLEKLLLSGKQEQYSEAERGSLSIQEVCQRGLDGAIGPATPGIEQGQGPAREQESWNFTLGPADQWLSCHQEGINSGMYSAGYIPSKN